MAETNICFVISPIGEENSEIRKRSDQVFKHIITPPVNECGFNPIRADQISEPGIITRQILQHIIDDPLVIADLTGHNPNVFYELAVRHVIRRPLIQISSKGEPTPFDVASTRIIRVDHQDLDSVEQAKEQISKQIKAVMSDPSKVDSPISMSLDLQMLKQSDEPDQRSLADIIEAISEVNLGIKNIQSELASESTLKNAGRFIEVIELSRRLSASLALARNQLEKALNKISDENNIIQPQLIKEEISYSLIELTQALEIANEQFESIRILEKIVAR